MVRISRKFKDISLSFTRNPVTNDIMTLFNDDAIKKSVVNLVRTRVGEKFFNSLVGTNVENSIFELQSATLARSLEEEIETLLNNFEPRISLSSVKITYPEESNELNVTLSYDIIGLPIPTQTVEFLLQPTRV
jgi:phage baseplate assembly protein W